MSSLLGAHNAIGRFMAQRKSSSTTSRISTHGAARSYYSSATAQSDLGSVQQSILNANANKRVTLGTLKPAEGSHKTVRPTLHSFCLDKRIIQLNERLSITSLLSLSR